MILIKNASEFMQKAKRKKTLKKRLKREYYKFIDGFVRSHGLQKYLKIGVFHMLYYFSYLGHFVVLRKQMIGCKQTASIISSVCKKIKIL